MTGNASARAVGTERSGVNQEFLSPSKSLRQKEGGK